MQMHHRSHLRQRPLGAMQRVIDWQKVPRGQLVSPLDGHRLAAFRFDRRPGKAVLEAPHARRRQVAMHLLPHLAHGHTVVGDLQSCLLRMRARVRRLHHARQCQRIDKRRQRRGIESIGCDIHRMGKRDARTGKCKCAALHKLAARRMGKVSHRDFAVQKEEDTRRRGPGILAAVQSAKQQQL